MHTRNLISTFKLESNGDDFIPTINSISWSPDGKYIAIGCSDSNGHQDRKTNAVQVWDIANQQWIYTYNNHVGLGGVFIVSWSPDGTRIASISFDLNHVESYPPAATVQANVHIWIAPR
ncbi:PD40 domain-containing protein [Ktedonobacter racemifer]|uniref:WD40 repeat domain-containing protein n=1 Tax=Ktedonobacter racemifer TaxID=363277 RepID=UPI0012F78D3B